MYSYIQYIQSLRLEHEQNPLLVIHQEACRKIVKQKIIEIFAAFLANFVNAGIYIFFRILRTHPDIHITKNAGYYLKSLQYF